jgi:hypothetical protein
MRSVTRVIAGRPSHRTAKLSLSDGAEVVEILHPDRLIEAPRLAEGGDDLGRRFRPHDHQRRIAGQAEDHESEGDDERDRQHGAAHTERKITDHQAALLPLSPSA